MQSGKNAMESAKEKVSNVSASAKAGMDKTKATAQETVEKMTTRDPIEKEMALERKEDRKRQAEMEKQMTREDNAMRKEEVRHAAVGGPTGHRTGLGDPTEGVVGVNQAGVRTDSGARTNPAGHDIGGRLL